MSLIIRHPSLLAKLVKKRRVEYPADNETKEITDMNTDLFAGRCKDCYNKRTSLREITDIHLAVRFVAGMSLCCECAMAREKEAHAGGGEICSRPFGITASEDDMEWVDLPPVGFIAGDAEPCSVEVKLLRPREVQGDQIAEIRFRFPPNGYWQPGGCLDFNTPSIKNRPEVYACSNVKGMLRQLFPHIPVAFT